MKTLIRREIAKAVKVVKTYQLAVKALPIAAEPRTFEQKKDGKSVAKTDEQQKPHEYRRFIPDARPITPHAGRGAFWYRIWLSMRLARLAQSAAAEGSGEFTLKPS